MFHDTFSVNSFSFSDMKAGACPSHRGGPGKHSGQVTVTGYTQVHTSHSQTFVCLRKKHCNLQHLAYAMYFLFIQYL